MRRRTASAHHEFAEFSKVFLGLERRGTKSVALVGRFILEGIGDEVREAPYSRCCLLSENDLRRIVGLIASLQSSRLDAARTVFRRPDHGSERRGSRVVQDRGARSAMTMLDWLKFGSQSMLADRESS